MSAKLPKLVARVMKDFGISLTHLTDDDITLLLTYINDIDEEMIRNEIRVVPEPA